MPLISKLVSAFTFCACVAGVFSSCSKKDAGGGGNPVNSSYLSSIRVTGDDEIIVDSFVYDANHQVALFEQYKVDLQNDISDTIWTSFTGTAGHLPDHYTRVAASSGWPDEHQLSYDGQGRITRDTSLNGSNFVTYYSYSGNYIICRILFEGTDYDSHIDTLVMNNGNMTGLKVWGIDQGVLEKQADVIYDHAAAANPAYKAEIANSVGPLLYILTVYNYGGYADFLSKSVINKVSGKAEGLPGYTISYKINVDGSGRVSSLTYPGVAGANTFNYY